MKVCYTPAAQDDLIGIAEYSFEQCGAERAELLGITRPVEGYPQLRRMQIDRHMLFFRIVDGVIEIVRILHERMLPEEHL